VKDDKEIKNAAIEAGLLLASGIEYLVTSRDLNDKQKVKAIEEILDLWYVTDINAGVEILIKERRLHYDK
jgi:hypothetical protein